MERGFDGWAVAVAVAVADNRWQLPPSKYWTSSCSATKYLASQFLFEICWLLFQILVSSLIYLFVRFWISHKFLHDWQFAKTVMSLRDKDASYLVELMLVAAWSVWERIPSCILLTHYWENLDEKQVSKPTSKSGGARPEKVLGWPWNRFGLCDRPVKRGTFLGLLTHVPQTASTRLFFRKWQQNVGVSFTNNRSYKRGNVETILSFCLASSFLWPSSSILWFIEWIQYWLNGLWSAALFHFFAHYHTDNQGEQHWCEPKVNGNLPLARLSLVRFPTSLPRLAGQPGHLGLAPLGQTTGCTHSL